MLSHTWRTTLDGRPLELDVVIDPEAGDLVVRVDGFPAARRALPTTLFPQHKEVVDVSGHRVAVVITPRPGRLAFDAALDGVCLTTGRPERTLGAGLDVGRLEPHTWRYLRAATDLQQRVGLATLAAATFGGWAGWRAMTAGPDDGALLLGGLALMTGLGAAAGLMNHVRDLSALAAWGEVVAGRVVALDPVRVACVIDLAVRGAQPAPTLVVSTQRLDRLGIRPQVGGRLLLLADYAPSQDGLTHPRAWIVAADLLSDDREALKALSRTPAEEAWDEAWDAWERAGQPLTDVQMPLSPEGERGERSTPT
jgi:hypothetical protein